MLPDLGAALRRLERNLSPPLVASGALPGLVALAAALPGPFAVGAVECRLGADPRVDLLACLRAPVAQGHLARLRALAEKRGAEESGARWRRILDFCTDWADPSSPLAAGVPALWLELDQVEPGAEAPSPWGFACVDPQIGEPASGPCRPVPGRALLHRVLAHLAGAPPPPQVAATLHRCLDHLPPDGTLLHVAPLAARGSDGVRIVAALPGAQLPAYLSCVGWPGEAAAAAELIGIACAFSGAATFQLDLGAAVQPALGLEVFYPGGAPDARWPVLLDELVARGACAPAKRDAAAAWPGEDPAAPPGGPPVRLHRLLQIKLVYQPGMPLAAKAYLGFTAYLAFRR